MSDYFKKGDIIVYVLLAFVIVACFISVSGKTEGELKRINVFCEGELCYSYDFVEGQSITYGKAYVSVEEKDGSIFVTLTKKGRNVLKVDINGCSAKMTEADCSETMECVRNFGAITSPNEIIVCAVHEITVVGVGDSDALPSGKLKGNCI